MEEMLLEQLKDGLITYLEFVQKLFDFENVGSPGWIGILAVGTNIATKLENQ